MYQRSNPDSRLPPRSSRHRSSVLGPPRGTNAGTGYISPPQTSPVTREFPEDPTSPPPSGLGNSANITQATSPVPQKPATLRPSSSAVTIPRSIPRKPVGSSTKNGRSESKTKASEMMENAPLPPPRSSKRGTKSIPRPSAADENGLQGVMFYPSTTTISSIDEAELRKVDQMEPMPFFKVDPRMPTMRGTMGSDDVRSSTSNPSRAVSTASSGVLGPVTIDVDPDTDNEEDDDDESIDSSASEFEHLVRNVSLVRRGTATIIRNASSRRSVVPEILQKRISTPPDMPLPQPPAIQLNRRISRQGGFLAPLVLSQFPPVPGPSRAPSSTYSQSTAASNMRGLVSPGSTSPRYAGPKLSPTLFPVSPQPSPVIRLPPTSPPPSTPTSNTSSGISSPSDNSSSNGRVKRRPPPAPINVTAIVEGETRGSMTSLPDLLNRATKLHEVLATGRTASSLNLHGFPNHLRDSTISTDGTRLGPGGPRGYFVNHFPSSVTKGPQINPISPARWPLFNFSSGSPRPAEPYQVYDARATTQGEAMRSNLFPKYDRNDSTPTGPLFVSPDGGNESVDGKGPTVRSERRCCGLQVRTFVIILLIVFVLVLIAVLVPILILRSRSSQSSTSSGLSLAQCKTQFPCQNGGANFLMGNPLQCTCLCAAGFSGSQCQTEDSACVPFSSNDDSANGTSIGSAIEPLLQAAQTNFSSQFNLSADRIIAQFSSNNVSCTSQNSLVVLNGSTSADLESSQIDRIAPNVLDLEALTTITVTKDQEATVLTTLPTVTVTVSNIMMGPTTSGGSTSTMTSSGVVTNTVTLMAQPGATLTPDDLVFGRCAILAVVQGFGVSDAADVQETMQLVINKGGTLVNDTTVGVAIDLFGRTITGLPKGG